MEVKPEEGNLWRWLAYWFDCCCDLEYIGSGRFKQQRGCTITQVYGAAGVYSHHLGREYRRVTKQD